MIIIKTIVLYFIQITRTDDFPSTGSVFFFLSMLRAWAVFNCLILGVFDYGLELKFWVVVIAIIISITITITLITTLTII